MKKYRLILRLAVLFLIVPALLIAAGGSFMFPGAEAEGPSQVRQIRSAKIKWVTNDSIQDGMPDRLYIRHHYNPDDKISMQYQIDIVLTGQEPHEPGTVRVLIPRHIFHGRSGRPDGSVLAAGCGNVSFSVPETPSEGSAWHWEEAENDQYAIVNDATIDAAAQVMFQCSVIDIPAQEIVDMRPSDPLKATVVVTGQGAVKDTMSTQELTAVIDTREALNNADNPNSKGAALTGTVYTTPETISMNFKEMLPGGPETANGYIFVRWRTQPYYDGTQYFSLDVDLWAGEAEGNGASIPGIVLGTVSGRGTISTQQSGEQAGGHYTATTASYRFDHTGHRDGNRAEDIWVAYPVAQMQKNKTYTIRSAATWQLTEADPAREGDPQEVSSASVTATVDYTHSGWEYPEGTFGVYKFTDSHPGHTHNTVARDMPDGSTNDYHNKNHTYEMGVGAIRNGQPVTMEYEVLTVGYGYKYTAGPTGEVPDLEEGWEFDPVHYLNWNYLMETTDEEVCLEANSYTLQPGDYRFDGITVAAPEMFTYGRQTQAIYQLPGTEYGYKPDTRLAKPPVEIWIRRDGAWELLNTVQVNSGTRWIAFPDGVTGYRTRILTNQAACKLAVWPKITLLSSEALREKTEEVLEHYTNLVLVNNVHLKTTWYYGAERADEVLPSQAAWLEAAAEDGHTVETDDNSKATLTVAGFKVSGDSGYNNELENDVANRRIRMQIYASVDEESNLTTRERYSEAVAMGAVVPETSGTWYILLPENMYPNTSSIRLRDNGGGDRVTDVEVRNNFRGSNRTLVVVRCVLKPDPSPYSGTTGYTDRLRFYMDAYLSWEDYNNLPSNNRYVSYYAAFESGNPGRLGNLPDPDSWYQCIGYPDVFPSDIRYFSNVPPAIRSLMTDLDPDTDEERFVYIMGGKTLSGIDVSEQVEFRKDACADTDGVWGKGTDGDSQITVPEGGTYTYRLTVASRHNSRTAGILIYDAVEEHVPAEEAGLDGKKAWSGYWNGRGQWQGTLTSVDVSELTAMGCAPKIYYSTVSGLEFGRANSVDPDDTYVIGTSFENWDGVYKLSDTDIWKQVPPETIVNGIWNVPAEIHVAAVAVDAQRHQQQAAYFQLRPGEKVSVYLHMKAPDDSSDPAGCKAKSAFARRTGNGLPEDDIDWERAADPANNMYAYNGATVVFVPFTEVTSSSQGTVIGRTLLNYQYTRVGIVPETITVRKTWKDENNYDGLRPDSVTVRLKGIPGNDSESPEVISDSLTLSAGNGWKGTFRNAPERDSHGNPYTYTVTEDPVDRYTATVIREGKRSYEIVNTHEREKVSITVKKLWLNPDGTPADPPENTRVTLWLSRAGKDGPSGPSYGKTAEAGNSWTVTFSGYDRYEEGGFEYKYSIREDGAPNGWFAQTETPPPGVTVTAEYDPDDIHTFRNFKKPDFGYAMVYCYLTDSSKPSEGNTAVPEFGFTVEMEDSSGAALDGEYEYIVYDKAPRSGSALPADAVQIGGGTVSNGGTITLAPEQCAVIVGLPGGSYCSVKETMGVGWTTSSSNPRGGWITSGRTTAISFRNEYAAKGPVVITGTKRLEGREQKAREFTFELIDDNPDDGDETYEAGSVVCTASTGESRGCVTGADGLKTGIALFTFRVKYGYYNEDYTLNEYGGTVTLRYKVRERIPDGAQENPDGSVILGNITYDTRIFQVTVTITDNRDGTLKVSATTPLGSLTVTNKFHTQSQVSLTARKEMIGRDLQGNDFTFEVRRSGAAADSAPIATGKNDADGNIAFSPAITLTERDYPQVTLVISEVQGTDPEVQYADPVPVTVTLLRKSDDTLVPMMHGQTLTYEESPCLHCGGSGKQQGLYARYIDITASPYAYKGDPFMVPGVFSSDYMDICPACGGSGYDPARAGQPCGTCDGQGIASIGSDPITLPDGSVLTLSGEHVPVSMIGQLGLDYSFMESTSCWAEVIMLVPADKVAAASGYDYLGLLYYADSDDPCPVCGGSGKTAGDPVVSGDPEAPVLTNSLKTAVTFTAEKTLDGQPAAEPFEFALLETDALRRTETEITRTKNGTDGKIRFEPVYLKAVPGEEHYYVIREIAGTDSGIAYDSGEDLYRVRMVRTQEGEVIADKTLMTGDGVFRNERVKGTGSLAVEVKTKGYNPDPLFWWLYEEPVFTVNITLKDSEGRPLAGQPLTAANARTAAGRNDAGTATDKDGRGTLRIKGGGTVEITGLPDGTVYKAEQPADSLPAGFSQSTAEGASGTIRSGAQSRAVFENAYQQDGPTPTPTGSPEPTETPSGSPEPSATPSGSPEPSATPTASPQPTKVPKTGDSADPLLWIGMMVLGLAAAGILTARKARKRK